MICVDVGSGYNPKPGYLTVDSNYGCDYYDIDEIPDNYVDKFHIRNVLHHIKDLDGFAQTLFKKQNDFGEVKIIDCNKEHYTTNYILDIIWYKYVFSKTGIFISSIYRDLQSPFIQAGYNLIDTRTENEKIILTLKKQKNDRRN